MTTLGTTAFQDAIREGRTALLPGCFPTASRAAKVLRFLRRVPRSPTHQGWDHNLKPQLLGLRGAFEGAVLTLAYFRGGGGAELSSKRRNDTTRVNQQVVPGLGLKSMCPGFGGDLFP